MSKTKEPSPDDERFLKEMFTAGWGLLQKHPGVKDKLLGIFKSSRDISPDEERELTASLEELKNDIEQGSRDLPSANVSSQDQERWLSALIGAATTAHSVYKAAGGSSTVKRIWKSIF